MISIRSSVSRTSSSLVGAMLVASLCSGSSFGAIIIADPGFENVISNAQAGSVGNVDPVGEATDTWYANNTPSDTRVWRQGLLTGPSGADESVAYSQSTTNALQTTRGLMQVVSGAAGSTGSHILKFDFLMNDGDTTPRNLIFGVEVFGIDNWDSATTGNYDLAEANNLGTLPVTYAASTTLLSDFSFTKTTDATVTGSTWQSASIPVDLGVGYPYIGVRFTAVKGFADVNGITQIAIDNVSMTASVPEPTSVMLIGLALAGLGVGRLRSV